MDSILSEIIEIFKDNNTEDKLISEFIKLYTD